MKNNYRNCLCNFVIKWSKVKYCLCMEISKVTKETIHVKSNFPIHIYIYITMIN